MSSNRIKLTRDQLAKFLPSHEAIKEFENLFSQNSEFEALIANILIGAGLNADGLYPPRTGSNYLDSSTSLYEDGTLLDIALLELIESTSVDKNLTATSQTVLVDATAGDIDIKLPLPSDCLNNGRSFRFAIHKIDSSSNLVNILPNGSELVMNEANQQLMYEGEILNFITDGTNWYLGA